LIRSARQGRVHAADADIGNTGMDQLRHSSQRLDVEPQGDGREFRLKCLHGIDQSRRRQHHIDGKTDLPLHAIEQPLDLGAQVFDADRDRPSFRQHRGAGLGQYRSPRPIAIEQLHAELLFQVGDRVADRGCGAPELTACRRKTSPLDHGDKHGELLETRHPRSRHFYFLEQCLRYFTAIPEQGECVSRRGTVQNKRWRKT
jgi:hypothetical protein